MPSTVTNSGVRTSFSVVMMSPTRRPISSPVLIRVCAKLHRQSRPASCADAPADLLDALGRGLAAAVGDPAVGRELAADPLDRVVRDAEVHHAAHRRRCVSSKLISTTTSFGGTICTSCGLLSTRTTASFSSSTFSQAWCSSSRNSLVIRETSRSSISVSGRRASGAAFAPAAQQPVDDRIEDRRVDVENQVAFERLGLQQVEAGGVFQAEDELAVGELIDAGELHLDDAAQQGRQGRAEVAAEALVQRLQRPHLLLADALGPLEVVGRDLLARLGRLTPSARPSLLPPRRTGAAAARSPRCRPTSR